MTKPWNMARIASRRALPKQRKMHGPVGEPVVSSAVDQVCSFCGFHICNCAPVYSLLSHEDSVLGAADGHAELVYRAISESRVFKQFEPVQPAVGTWEWAKTQMEQGRVVRRECWSDSVLRIRGGRLEMTWTTSVQWADAEYLDYTFSDKTDWQLVDVDHGSAAPQTGTWEWAKSQMKRGKIVKRALWETTILRNTHGYPEMSSNAGKNWRGAAHIEDVFEKRTNWQLVDVDPR